MNIRNHQTGEIIPLIRDMVAEHPDWVYEQCLDLDEPSDELWDLRLQNMLDQYDISDFADNGWERDVCGITYDADEIAEYEESQHPLA